MAGIQDQHERSIGDAFFEWFNAGRGTSFTFLRRGGDAPDLVYGADRAELGVEITGAYYDADHGAFLWKSARGAPDAPGSWFGVNPDQSLASAAVKCIQAKCAKRYGSNTLLLVNIPPGTTSVEELERRLSQLVLPSVVRS